MMNNNYDKEYYAVNRKMPYHICEEWKKGHRGLKETVW